MKKHLELIEKDYLSKSNYLTQIVVAIRQLALILNNCNLEKKERDKIKLLKEDLIIKLNSKPCLVAVDGKGICMNKYSQAREIVKYFKEKE